MSSRYTVGLDKEHKEVLQKLSRDLRVKQSDIAEVAIDYVAYRIGLEDDINVWLHMVEISNDITERRKT